MKFHINNQPLISDVYKINPTVVEKALTPINTDNSLITTFNLFCQCFIK